MKMLTLVKRSSLLIGMGLVLISAAAILSFAADSSPKGLSIEPVKAIYMQRDGGDYFQIGFTIINYGKEEVTIVTEHLDRSFRGIDKETNSLRCVLSFDREIFYKKEHRVIPSIYKYAPVTLKPGEAASVNYFEDYSNYVNHRGMSEKNLKADNIVISYEISPFWAERFNLWQGQLLSSPIEFRKIGKNNSIE
jgi:hypothetical protein